MLFWILLSAAFVIPIIGAVIGATGGACDGERPAGIAFLACMGLLVGSMAGLMLAGLPVLLTWSEHAGDISKVEAQHHRIEVYTERIDSLERRLSEFDYPSKPLVSIDADTPWASMVHSLNDAETELAKAKDERAIAIRSIRARMRGPMSGVVSFVGLPDGWNE